MHIRVGGPLLAAAVLGAVAMPAAAETVKIGVIAPLSGPADAFGLSWRQGIATYMKVHGDTVDGNKVEVIYRDLPGPNPGQAKALAQELVVKEGVQYLAGFAYTPNVFAVAALATQARVPTVIMGASTSSIMGKSPYFLRTSLTVPQLSVPAAINARAMGYRKIVTLVPDYAPGWDAEVAFTAAFEKNGGAVVGKLRIPLSAHDFVPYINKAAALKPDALFGFMPGGGTSYELLSAYNNSGLKAAGVPYLGETETTENDLPHYGDVVLGLLTVNYYSAAHDSPANAAFKTALKAVAPKEVPAPFQISAYDGMEAIYRMIAATHGKKDGDAAIAAAAGMKWEAPQGPVAIDAKTRDFIQNVYVRRVAKAADGALYNKELAVFPMQPDYGRPGTPIPTVDSLKAEPIAGK